MTFFSVLPSVNENCERESNPMPQSLCLYLSGPAFLVSLTDPNKRSLMWNLCLNFLTMDLVCKKYIDLLIF